MTESIARPRRGRPPKTDRSFDDTREALLRQGMAVLTEQGFSSAGIDGILRAVGVPKGSFYHYFANKEAFGLAVLERYDAYFAAKLSRNFQDADQPPLERLRRFADEACAGMARHRFRRGCLVGNLGQEVGLLPPSFRNRLGEVFAHWQRLIAALLREARDCGDLAADADCDALAEYFWIGWEGAVMRARLSADGAPLERFIELFIAGLPQNS
ncbi:TetR family transcriptional regulator [Marinobacterium nitratireducens]|uniref:TetR family transcriptional regulator n=1 Tax=Marinobacterium nitratireducens TaxID=518897 RepID=A0A917ZAL1_9GAMM|nr:TetR/AcrR family transcriptional regulator [Marinobacterium nitratireducens]GGO77557.1 TetR family transcriptional regulator [Marinobacterium nitratireducens]